MKVLYSTQSVVEFDGCHYYNNAIKATYPRYFVLGDEITVLTHMIAVDKPKSDMIDDNAVRFVFIPKLNSLNSLLHNYKKVNQILDDEVRKADVCVVHMNDHGTKIVSLANKYHKPVLSVVGGCPWDALWNYDWRGKLLAPWSCLKTKIAQRNVNYTIYVTKSFLQNRYPNGGRWIACSNINIVTGVPGVLENRLANIEKRLLSNRTLRIGTAAAVDVPYKGQEYVIRALSRLKKKGLDFEYHLIGLGSNERLQKIAKSEDVLDRVFFHGPLPHAEVLTFMDDIDIYIQPSKQEGLPRATIEAMSRGCLCLGSRVAGIPELLETKYLFKKGSVKEIASILEKINLDDIKNQARRNYEEAKDYDKNLLDERRASFLLEFKNSYNQI